MILLDVNFQSFLVGVALVAMLTRKTVSKVTVVPFNMGQEGKLLKEQLVTDKAFKCLPVVGSTEVNLELHSRSEDHIALPAASVELAF